MKVYVSELPKSCSECEWFTPNHCSKNGRNFCLLARMPFCNTQEERQTTRGQHKDSLSDFDCPLQSLTDYTKQAKKELCEKIYKALTSDDGWRIMKAWCNFNGTCEGMRIFLDRIQGENV